MFHYRAERLLLLFPFFIGIGLRCACYELRYEICSLSIMRTIPIRAVKAPQPSPFPDSPIQALLKVTVVLSMFPGFLRTLQWGRGLLLTKGF